MSEDLPARQRRQTAANGEARLRASRLYNSPAAFSER